MYDLSILIPARNEEFLAKTVENILENIEGKTEVIILLDGQWSDPPVVDDPRVTIIYYPESIGQRKATNAACKLSSAKYVMKVDAHCAFDKGFDVKMMAKMRDNYTMVPVLRNLHVFDWVCNKCGNRWYQGPTPTFCHKEYDEGVKVKTPNLNCNNTTDFRRDVVFKGKNSPNNGAFCFDSTPHFQYMKEYEKTQEFKDSRPTGITETMSLQGSCFMLTREKYWELEICGEDFPSWGSQGIEVACKTWLSGGKVVCNWDTWYAHMFRTQGGDFGFPYPLPGSQTKEAKEHAKNLFINGQWKGQIKPFSWLLSKFWPVKGWDFIPDERGNPIDPLLIGKIKEQPMASIIKSSDIPTKGIIFYTDNQLPIKIADKVQSNLRKICRDRNMEIVSASLKPMNFGNNVYTHLKRGYLTMFKQILAALETSTADIVYFCEHDVLYHPSHFDFIPEKKAIWYYNENVWKVDWNTGKALHYDCKQTSGICVWRETAVEHYRKRVAVLEKKFVELSEEDFNRYIRAVGFEPGTHNREERIDDATSERYFSEFPNVDIRHSNNLTESRWRQDQFRNQKNCQNWIEAEVVPGWEKVAYTS